MKYFQLSDAIEKAYDIDNVSINVDENNVTEIGFIFDYNVFKENLDSIDFSNEEKELMLNKTKDIIDKISITVLETVAQRFMYHNHEDTEQSDIRMIQLIQLQEIRNYLDNIGISFSTPFQSYLYDELLDLIEIIN